MQTAPGWMDAMHCDAYVMVWREGRLFSTLGSDLVEDVSREREGESQL